MKIRQAITFDDVLLQPGASEVMPADVNGDGKDDMLVGAPYSDAGVTDGGAAFLFLSPF